VSFRAALREQEKVLKAAVIGSGYLGNFHAQKYAASPHAELLAVVDLELARAKSCAKKFSCEALTDYRQLPALGVQCASVVATTSAHFDIASWLLQNGIDVLVEKPITVTVEEAKELIAIARKQQRILQVGHLQRFNSAFKAVKQHLTEPKFFEVRRITKFSGRGTDVDVILDLMIHDIDIVSHLIGEEVTKVDAIGSPVITNSIDIANARVVYANGAVANFSASRAAFTSERTMRIFQPELYISADYEKNRVKICRRSSKKSSFGFPEIEVLEKRFDDSDALAEEIESFLSCVANRTQPLVAGEAGLHALKIAYLIKQSLLENVSQAIPDSGNVKVVGML